MKKILGFVVGTAAVLAFAIGYQAVAAGGEETKGRQVPAAEGPSPSAGATSDDGERDGFTEDHQGKPGENK